MPPENPGVRHGDYTWLDEPVEGLAVRVCGADGITAYHRIKGKEYAKRSIGFGEALQPKLPSNGPTNCRR